jgi:hypothetical protein
MFIYVCVFVRACLRRAAALWPNLWKSYENLLTVNKRLVPISTKTKLLRSYDR